MKKTRKKITNGIIFIIVAVYAVVSVYPLIWVILQSFKSESQFLQSIWSLPSSLHFENYQTAFTTGKLGLYFFNTVKNTAATLVVDLVLITLAAFAFSKLKMKFKKFFYYFILINLSLIHISEPTRP